MENKARSAPNTRNQQQTLAAAPAKPTTIQLTAGGTRRVTEMKQRRGEHLNSDDKTDRHPSQRRGLQRLVKALVKLDRLNTPDQLTQSELNLLTRLESGSVTEVRCTTAGSVDRSCRRVSEVRPSLTSLTTLLHRHTYLRFPLLYLLGIFLVFSSLYFSSFHF